MVAHFFACLWCLVYHSEKYFDPNVKGWLDKVGDSDYMEWYAKYIYAYYFSMVTMLTVGYGDISPVTFIEIFVCILTMLIGIKFIIVVPLLVLLFFN
jgi:hypothetical protein